MHIMHALVESCMLKPLWQKFKSAKIYVVTWSTVTIVSLYSLTFFFLKPAKISTHFAGSHCQLKFLNSLPLLT